MNVAEAFYQLRRMNPPETEAIDTIHAAMESLRAANVALEAEVVRLKGELEQWHQRAINAENECFELRSFKAKHKE